MTPKEILIAARAKIEAPERWTQGKFAQTPMADEVPPDSPLASCWCVLGAIAAITHDDPHDIRDEVYWPIHKAIGLPADSLAIPAWNDAPTRTHAEVLAAFDRAIAAADSV